MSHPTNNLYKDLNVLNLKTIYSKNLIVRMLKIDVSLLML